MSAGFEARLDQVTAAARDLVEPLGGRVVDSRDALLTFWVAKDGMAHLTATTDALRWVADALAQMADVAARRASAAGQ